MKTKSVVYWLFSLFCALISSLALASTFIGFRHFISEDNEGSAPQVFVYNMALFFPAMIISTVSIYLSLFFLIPGSMLENGKMKLFRVRNIFPILFIIPPLFQLLYFIIKLGSGVIKEILR
ncbi:MAG: hypothetical protein KBG21_04515 [Ignavibacteria bacterium]|nr:hypothetical protein [Ignavibacteria bacterium]